MTYTTVKQQAIIDAYGENYKKCEPDENGWIKLGWGKYANDELQDFLDEFEIHLPITDFDYYCTDDFDYGLCYARLKSLAGVEDNNNWKRIESEDDLPKDYGLYHVFTKAEMFCKEPKNQGIEEFWTNDKNKTDWWLQNVSHYQLVNKPNKPIY